MTPCVVRFRTPLHTTMNCPELNKINNIKRRSMVVLRRFRLHRTRRPYDLHSWGFVYLVYQSKLPATSETWKSWSVSIFYHEATSLHLEFNPFYLEFNHFFPSSPTNIFTYTEANLVFIGGQPSFYWRPTDFDWSLAPFYLEFNQLFFLKAIQDFTYGGQPSFYWRPTLFTWRPTHFDWGLAPFYLEFNQANQDFTQRPTSFLLEANLFLPEGQLISTGA